MENIYSLCFYGGLALAIIFLIATVVLFVVLKIPKVVGDLTGRNAKKSIDEMKSKRVASSDVSRKEQAKYYNQSAGRIKVKQGVSAGTRESNGDDTTDLLAENRKAPRWNDSSGELESLEAEEGRTFNPDVTEVLGAVNPPKAAKAQGVSSNEEETAVLHAEEEATEVLNAGDDMATVVLHADEEATDVLRADEEATAVLRTDEEATAVLRENAADEEATAVLRENAANAKPRSTSVIYNVVVTHTEETI